MSLMSWRNSISPLIFILATTLSAINAGFSICCLQWNQLHQTPEVTSSPKLSTISPYQRYVTGSNWSTSILKICSNWSIMCRLRRQLCRYQCETSGIRGGVWLALNWLHLHCSSICTTLAMYLHWYFYYSALALSGMQCNRGVDEIHGSFGKPLPAISLSYFISTFFSSPRFTAGN